MRTRKEIEKEWVESRGIYSPGKTLCVYTNDISLELRNSWKKVWGDVKMRAVDGNFDISFISEYFKNEVILQDKLDMAYLCRALSLNLLLDDNEELLG